MIARTWEDNAAEFGALAKQGKDIRLALLAACSVEKGVGHGGDRRSDQVHNRELETNGKVSAKKFAEEADVSVNRVIRHLAAWDKLSELTNVPKAAMLTPEHGVLMLTDDQLEVFRTQVTLGNTTREAVKGNARAVADLLITDPDFVSKVVGHHGVVAAVLGSEAVTPDEFLAGMGDIEDAVRADPVAAAKALAEIAGNEEAAILAENVKIRAEGIRITSREVQETQEADRRRKKEKSDKDDGRDHDGTFGEGLKFLIGDGEIESALATTEKHLGIISKGIRAGGYDAFLRDPATRQELSDFAAETEAALHRALTVVQYISEVVEAGGPEDMDAGLARILDAG